MNVLYVAGSIFMLASCNSSPSEPDFLSISLHKDWYLYSPDTLDSYPATVPGTVHTDLMSAGIIPDPFYGSNVEAVQWIENHSWVYSCSFDLHINPENYDATELIFEGLDTYANVWLNEIPVLNANNMFRSWRIPVQHLIKEGSNNLRVEFLSPKRVCAPMLSKQGFIYPADNDESKISPYVRKAAYHFGWDWAPRLVTSGVWKPVRLEFFQKAALRDCSVAQLKLNPEEAVVRITAEVESFMDAPFEGTLDVGGAQWKGSITPGLQRISVDVTIHKPTLWWPNGEGTQNLYHYQAVLGTKDRQLHKSPITVGLRTIALVNEPDSIGTSFYFKVNGKPLFMKGANYIPQDVFLPRVRDAQYRELLLKARDANMNMLRVWGGGVYERDLFYHLCDSLGILVWQDFMLAGTMYPADDAFLDNVRQEAQEQVRRIGKHPCLALWCGNNEIEVAWQNWGWQKKYGYTGQQEDEMLAGYNLLFHSLLPDETRKHSHEIPYVSTSPQSNWGKAENFNHGSMHYWGVWHGREPASAFSANVGRFMVEYGMQSYPAEETLMEYVQEGHMNLDSSAIAHRQKSYIGNQEMLRHINDMGEQPATFSEFIASSQRAQSHALQLATEAHVNAQGHCMGSLLWQLNDCWPGPSWSIVDYAGREKAAYGAVQQAFSTKPIPELHR